MKKAFAISFLFLANIVFVAHAVVPHYHHDGMTCFTASHCVDSEECDHEDAQTHSHEHSENTLCRVLQDVVPSESNSQKIKVEINDFQSFFLVIIPELINLGCSEVDIALLLRENSQKPFYESIIVSSQGLRAPPLC